MRILLIGINFGNYEKRIIDVIKKQGHEVFYMFDTDEHFSFYQRIFGETFAKKKTIQYQNKMLRIMPKSFDRVIVIVGRMLTSSFLYMVKKNSPRARYILYLWDDVKRVENFEETKDVYNEIYSFDLKDCKDYGFKHLPLFFNEFPNKRSDKVFDIYSAMFSHSEREKIIKSIDQQASALNKKCRFYVCLGRYTYLKRQKEIKKNHNGDIIYISKPIDENENYANMNKAKIILDVQFSSQIGLTMRTIESLGMKNKLITTNSYISYYDFYNENNICIIDRDQPKIDTKFLDKPYIEIDTDIYKKYSLDTWVKTLTGEITLNNYLGKYDIKKIEF